MDANVPCDLLLISARVLAICALVKAGCSMGASMLFKHELVVAGEPTDGALQQLVLRGALLVVV